MRSFKLQAPDERVWRRFSRLADVIELQWLPLLALSTGTGLFLVGLADAQGRLLGPTPALPLFWAGMLLIAVPAVWRVLSTTASRRERISIVVGLGLVLYVLKVMVSPLRFSLPDEFSHWRTLNDILASTHLFQANPLLPISPVYPGLEAATAAAQVSTGLDTFPLAMILLGVARGVTMLGCYMLATRITGSDRVAGAASIVYMSNTSFLPFDAQFAYESLAIPLAFLAIWAVLSWSRDPRRWLLYGVIAFGAIAATTATHHLTSAALVALLITWAVLAAFRERRPRRRWPIIAAATWAIAVNFTWLVTVGGPALVYLNSIVLGGVDELLAVLAGNAPGRQLFISRAGFGIPLPEIIVAYSAVVLLLLALPPMLLHAVRGHRPSAILLTLTLSALLYPASLALRFTSAGSETSQRASEFLFLPLGVLGADWLVGPRPTRWRPGTRLLTPLLLVVFAGGIVSGDPPQGRLPGPYHVAAEQLSIEPQGIETAVWMLRELGPGNRLIADRTNGKLLGSIGAQYPVTASNQHVGTAYVMFASTVGRAELVLLRTANVRYLVVDLRLARDVPVFKYYFESAEPDAGRHAVPMPMFALEKFDEVAGVTRIYDSGDIIIYDVRALVVGAG